jgi:lysylphosphatidylglycerol synthetase-like protein (DUF2156 family)
MDRFACAYCGTEHIVKRGGGVISLAPVVEGLKKVEIGVDKTASELALKRLKEEIPQIEAKINSIRNKGYPNSYEQVLAILMIFFGAIFILTFFVPNSSNTAQSFVIFADCGLVLLLAGIVIYIAAHNAAKAFDQKKKADLESLLTLWRQKQAELKYHQNIVDRPHSH